LGGSPIAFRTTDFHSLRVWVIDFKHTDILQYFGKTVGARVETGSQNNQLNDAPLDSCFEASVNEAGARDQNFCILAGLFRRSIQ
jgi:hypothetical protein